MPKIPEFSRTLYLLYCDKSRDFKRQICDVQAFDREETAQKMCEIHSSRKRKYRVVKVQIEL